MADPEVAPKPPPTVYLGDGAYARVEYPGNITIFTSDGIEERNHISLEVREINNLTAYAVSIGMVLRVAFESTTGIKPL